MTKQKKKGNNLHPLQKEIVLNLSKNGPQTINKTVKNIKKYSYKPSWNAFNSLEEKGLLTKVKTKPYHGRQFPEFWLTDIGILTALIEGASPTDLLTQSKEVYPNSQELQYFLRIIPNFNPDIIKIILTDLKNKGKLEPTTLTTIMFTQADSNATYDKFANALEIMKEYPKWYKDFKEYLTVWRKNLNKLSKIINKQPLTQPKSSCLHSPETEHDKSTRKPRYTPLPPHTI